MKVRLAKKQKKKARPYLESQGYRFRRKAKISFFPRGYYLWYSFVDMDGRIQNHFPIRIKSRRNRKSRA